MEKKTLNMLNVTWDEIGNHSKILAEKIKQTDIKYDCIVCVGRGGMIPARLLSELLDINTIYMYNIKAYNDIAVIGQVETKPFNYDLLKNKNVLIVDDVYTTGNTLDFVCGRICQSVEEIFITTVALYENTQQLIIERQPDFYSTTYNSETDWIVFPWESIKDNNENQN